MKKPVVFFLILAPVLAACGPGSHPKKLTLSHSVTTYKHPKQTPSASLELVAQNKFKHNGSVKLSIATRKDCSTKITLAKVGEIRSNIAVYSAEDKTSYRPSTFVVPAKRVVNFVVENHLSGYAHGPTVSGAPTFVPLPGGGMVINRPDTSRNRPNYCSRVQSYYLHPNKRYRIVVDNGQKYASCGYIVSEIDSRGYLVKELDYMKPALPVCAK